MEEINKEIAYKNLKESFNVRLEGLSQLIFRKDSVTEKTIKRRSLFRIIEESKAKDGAIVQVAAANAITVLNMLE